MDRIPNPDEATAVERKHVLLVDDDIDVLGAMGRFLRLNAFDVTMAQDMASAVKRLNAVEALDAVVTDFNMEGGTGNDLCGYIRSEFPSIPVILFSGMASTREVVEAMQMGAVTFLEKPISPDELLAVLDKAIAGVGVGTANPMRISDETGTPNASLNHRVRQFEKFLIEQALVKHDWRVKDAMESLGLNRRTMNEKMSRLGIKRP